MKIFGTKRNAAHYDKKPSRAPKVLIILLVVILLIGGGVYAFLNLFPQRPGGQQPVLPPRPTPTGGISQGPIVPEPPRGSDDREEDPDILTILVAGQDNIGEYGLSDTILLAAIDVANSRVDVVSIPRDTKVDLPWIVPKINAVIAMTGSVDRLMDEVEKLIGFLPDAYVIIDMDAFEALVETIGGVYFDVPRTMIYDDPCQGLHIWLSPGYQHLNGTQAIHLIRWRQNNDGSGYPDGDIGRIATQHAFMGALARELLQIRNVTRINELARIFSDYVDTSLTYRNIAWFALELMDMDPENIHFHTIPADTNAYVNGGAYVVLYIEEWLEMVNTYFNPHPYEIREENVRIPTWRNGFVQAVGEGLTLTPR